jgi:hypothetical protein
MQTRKLPPCMQRPSVHASCLLMSPAAAPASHSAVILVSALHESGSVPSNPRLSALRKKQFPFDILYFSNDSVQQVLPSGLTE